MIVTLLLIALSLAAIYWYIFEWKYKYWERRGIPYTQPVFPYGSIILGKELHWGEQCLRDYLIFKNKSPFYGGFRLVEPVVYINDIKLAKQIMNKDFNSFIGRGLYDNPRDDPLNSHLFVIEGPKWKRLREKLTPVFTSGKIKYMMPTVLEVSTNLIDVMSNEIKINTVLDIKEWVARFTTDVIGTCAFGLKCNSLEDPNAKFREMGKKVFGDLNPWVILMTMNAPSLSKMLHLSFNTKEVSDFFLNAVEETIKYREANNIERNDFMDLVIKLRNKDKSNDEKDSEMNGLSIHEIAAQAFVFFLAGFETSSTVTSYTMLELAMNQDLQKKARAHINEILKKHNNQITYECLQDMTYIEQCMNESMRKYPTLAVLFRTATENYSIPDTSYTMKKGTFVVIPSYAFNHDPEIWPQPKVFDPDRFQSNDAAFDKGFFPFGSGPRNCIGERFGKIQTKIGLITLLKNFEFTPTSKTIYPVKFSTKLELLSPNHELYLNVKKI